MPPGASIAGCQVLAADDLEQLGDLRQHVRQLQDLGLQGLLAGKGQQLPCQRGGAVGIRLDLLDLALDAGLRRVLDEDPGASEDLRLELGLAGAVATDGVDVHARRARRAAC